MQMKSGGNWREALATEGLHVKVASVWAEVKQGWVKVAGTWEKFHQYATFSFSGSTTYRKTVPGGVATVTITMQTNGDGTQNADNGTFNGWWNLEPEPGVGTDKYVQAVKTGGDAGVFLDFLTEDTWYQLNAPRTFGITADGEDRNWVGDFEFRYGAAGPADYTRTGITFDANGTP
jgi:hypothetical protein